MLAGSRVLLGVTGGVAAYKAAVLARLLTVGGAEVTAVLTDSATRFVGADTFSGLTGREAFTSLWERPGEVLHVRLARGSDLAVVAPCTANTLAKLASGLADDLLTATLLEFRGPLVLAPAMHTGMWEHAATRANVVTLQARGVHLVGPVVGALAHGDEGLGRMSEPDEIFSAVASLVTGGPLDGVRVLVTAGPTQEPIDPVRFIGNRSTGRMGIAVAAEAHARGASVTLILGPDTVAPPAGVEVVRVGTAEEMGAAVRSRSRDASVIVMAAAVADFRPTGAPDAKIKKDGGIPHLALEPTADILSSLASARRPGQILVGFAAETEDVVAAGARKRERKGIDLLVANLVGRDGTGFGAETNEAAIIGPGSDPPPLSTWTKTELASALLDRVHALLL